MIPQDRPRPVKGTYKNHEYFIRFSYWPPSKDLPIAGHIDLDGKGIWPLTPNSWNCYDDALTDSMKQAHKLIDRLIEDDSF